MTLVRNGAGAPGTRQRRASRRRSTSLTASDRSDLSRITLVENDPELAADDGSKSDDSYEIISYYPPKYSLVEHLRGLFRPNLSKKKATMRKEYSRAKTPAGSVVCRPPSFALFIRSDADIYYTISSINSLTRTYRMIKTSQHWLHPGFSLSMSTQIGETKALRLFPRSENVPSIRAIYKATSCLVSSLKQYSNILQNGSAS
jgi:hypothetical protein